MEGRRHPGFSPRFFLEVEPTAGDEVALSSEDSHHAIRVLRLRQGDLCEVVTPSGWVREAVVTSTGEPLRVRVGVPLDGEAAGARYRTKIGIVQALARPSAVDLVIEKGTEVGASFFLLVQTDGSPRPGKGRDIGDTTRLVRWRRIAREAAKQSKHIALPTVDIAHSVADAVRLLATEEAVSLILEPGSALSLPDSIAPEARMLAIWVGPEGGWTQAELQDFASAGFPSVRLGRGILRTETAGPVAVAVARLALGDW